MRTENGIKSKKNKVWLAVQHKEEWIREIFNTVFLVWILKPLLVIHKLEVGKKMIEVSKLMNTALSIIY